MGGAPPIMKLAGSLPFHLAFATLASTACIADSLPVGQIDDPTVGGTEAGNESATTESLETEGSTSSPSPSSTGDEASSGETGDGEELCPEASGWHWFASIGTEDENELTTVLDTIAGGVIVAGTLDDDPFFPVMRRYDASGALLWEQQGASEAEVEDVRVLPNGDVVVCGHFGHSSPVLWLARYDSMGNELWAVDEPDMFCRAVDVTAAGDIVVGGVLGAAYTDVPGGMTAVLRFDGSGTPLGSWTADLQLTAGIHKMAAVGEEVVLLGEYLGSSGFWIGRLDAGDQLAWSESYFDMGPYARGSGLTVDPATGDIVVVGFSEPRPGDPHDLAAWRLSADGTMQWQASHDVTGLGEEASEVRIAPDGTLVVAAYVNVNEGSGFHPVLAALDPEGGLTWSVVLEDLGDHAFAIDLALDDCGAIYVSGWERDRVQDDGWVGRYVPPRGL
jgi:hypothetical protein